MLAYFTQHRMELLRALVEHIEMSATALFIACVVALPLGYALSRTKKPADVALAVLGILYSIPSMALLVLLIPFFGLGPVSAIIALVLYAQFALVRSVLLGFRTIEPSLLEAGKGMGMNARQQLFQLELPLALPTFIGGLRIAATTVIGLASMAAWINAGGLGALLFQGIYQNHTIKILWGTLLISGLAICVECALSHLERHALREAQGR